MSNKKIVVSKTPDLLTTTPTHDTYRNLSESELLSKVRLLHEQVLKTNKYLMDVHRMSIYNYDINDTGNIVVELPESKKGFLLDAVVRLRGIWNPQTNTPTLTPHDESKVGWVYKVETSTPFIRFEEAWKTGDYALYDEHGNLYNVQAKLLESLFTPLVLIDSETITFENLPQSASGMQLKAHVKLSENSDNDLSITEQGLFSDAYKKSKTLLTVQEIAPTEDNTEGGLRIVYLQTAPQTFYNGWLYLIPNNLEELEN
jgi:hypothetical protein